MSGRGGEGSHKSLWRVNHAGPTAARTEAAPSSRVSGNSFPGRDGEGLAQRSGQGRSQGLSAQQGEVLPWDPPGAGIGSVRPGTGQLGPIVRDRDEAAFYHLHTPHPSTHLTFGISPQVLVYLFTLCFLTLSLHWRGWADGALGASETGPSSKD